MLHGDLKAELHAINITQTVKQLPSKLQNILELLDDGRLHGLDELQEKTELSEKQTRELVAFLTEYGFAEINHGNKNVRISQAAKKLLAQTTM